MNKRTIHKKQQYTITKIMQEENKILKLDSIEDKAPCFLVDPKNIVVLSRPNDFYSKLKENISTCKKRIVLSSLYLGTGNLEQKLVESIEKNLEENDQIKVKILLDHNRGQRGTISSKSILLPLIDKFSERFSLYLYHTPKLRGLLKKLTPERTNETIGVQHMKIYITDNDLIISGANLSNDYFENRQDRYILIKDCELLCDFFESLINIISSFSYVVNKLGHLEYKNNENTIHPLIGDKQVFGNALGTKLNNLFEKYIQINSVYKKEKHFDLTNMAYVYPLIQMKDAFITIDEYVTNNFFENAEENSKIFLAVGYFNLIEDYIKTIVGKSLASFDLLLSSPESNGFFNDKGLSKFIPDIYSYLEEDFFKYYNKNKQNERINMYEYKKTNWTFHAKGLWYYRNYNEKNNNCLPIATIVGSSNFGYRSVNRDLEANLLIYSRDANFQNQLHQERKNLYENTIKVDYQLFMSETRMTPFWLKMFSKSFRTFF